MKKVFQVQNIVVDGCNGNLIRQAYCLLCCNNLKASAETLSEG